MAQDPHLAPSWSRVGPSAEAQRGQKTGVPCLPELVPGMLQPACSLPGLSQRAHTAAARPRGPCAGSGPPRPPGWSLRRDVGVLEPAGLGAGALFPRGLAVTEGGGGGRPRAVSGARHLLCSWRGACRCHQSRVLGRRGAWGGGMEAAGGRCHSPGGGTCVWRSVLREAVSPCSQGDPSERGT